MGGSSLELQLNIDCVPCALAKEMWRAPGIAMSFRRALPVGVPKPGLRWCAWAAEGERSIPVYLREGAVRKLKSLQDEQQKSVLRLMVNSGGCSGYSYEFNLVDKV